MDYESFKTMMKENLKDYLPATYSDSTVQVVEVNKLGRKYDGLCIKQPEGIPTPVANLQELYEEYVKNLDDALALETASQIVQCVPHIPGLDNLPVDYDSVKDRLFIRLSNTENNREALSAVPHKDFEDLSVTCHVLVGTTGERISSYMVTNKLLKSYGISKEKLLTDALENSQKLFPPMLKPIHDVIGLGMRDDEKKMLVLSNPSFLNGAASLFYENCMDRISEAVGGDFVILPSSVHELIVLKDDGSLDYNDLAETVRNVNRTMVKPSEFLSDHVYRYDAQEHSFSVQETAGLEQVRQKTHYWENETIDLS